MTPGGTFPSGRRGRLGRLQKAKKKKYGNKNSVQQKHKMTKNYCNPSKVRRMNIKKDIYSIVYCKAVGTIRYNIIYVHNCNATPIFFVKND
jgi:chemotaxis methyl-accepting protein methylase